METADRLRELGRWLLAWLLAGVVGGLVLVLAEPEHYWLAMASMLPVAMTGTVVERPWESRGW